MKEFDSASHIFNRCYENVNVRNKVKLQGPEKVWEKKTCIIAITPREAL